MTLSQHSRQSSSGTESRSVRTKLDSRIADSRRMGHHASKSMSYAPTPTASVNDKARMSRTSLSDGRRLSTQLDAPSRNSGHTRQYSTGQTLTEGKAVSRAPSDIMSRSHATAPLSHSSLSLVTDMSKSTYPANEDMPILTVEHIFGLRIRDTSAGVAVVQLLRLLQPDQYRPHAECYSFITLLCQADRVNSCILVESGAVETLIECIIRKSSTISFGDWSTLDLYQELLVVLTQYSMRLSQV